MDDLDEVRAALGYDKINIIGGSYGTRATQEYLRRHGKRVRAVRDSARRILAQSIYAARFPAG
jgi:pimeloyl-ACP methyl ester carboxylesterase